MKERIAQLIRHLTEGLEERDEAVKLTILSAIAGESIFLYGPPGVGKSLIARRLKYAFADGKSFEYLMTRFSTPEEIFGPISIRKLKEEDRYERLTDEYLPGANVVFLDEIWKSSSAIQNALLTILNERIYRNGTQEIKVNLHAIVAASNELPPEGESFGPLWDRFLIRYQVLPVKNPGAFLRLITSNKDVYQDPIPSQLKITLEELADWNAKAEQIEIPDEIATVIHIIRQKLDEAEHQSPDAIPFRIYDRRWKKIVKLLKVSAFLNGRKEIHLSDVYLCIHCLWNDTSQIPVVRRIVTETLREHGYNTVLKLSLLSAEIQRYESEIQSETQIKVTDLTEIPKTIKDEYFRLEKCDELPAARLMKIVDYKILHTTENQVINYYDDEFKLVYRLQTSLGSRPYTIRIQHNSRTIHINLESVKQEVVRTVFKAPHPLVKAYWDEWGQRLTAFLDEKIYALKNNVPQALLSERDHLYVDASVFDLISENFEKTRKRLDQLKLRLEKAIHMYASTVQTEKV